MKDVIIWELLNGRGSESGQAGKEPLAHRSIRYENEHKITKIKTNLKK